MSPGSDRGTSGSDNITNVNQPTFIGTAPPGSTVQLFAQAAGGGPVLVGGTTAGPGGDWTLTVGPLADGTYTISATTTDQAGQTSLPTPLLSSDSRPLVIDTVGPRITGVPVAPRIGRIWVYSRDDRAGMDQASLTDAAHYALIPLPSRRARFLATVALTSPEAGPTELQPVAVTINNGRRLPRGQAQLTIVSGGMADRAGNALDGEFSGLVPLGERPGRGRLRGAILDRRTPGLHAPAGPVPVRPPPAKGLSGPLRREGRAVGGGSIDGTDDLR